LIVFLFILFIYKRFFMSDLPSLMMDLFCRAGMPADAVDVSALQERIGGVVLSQRQSVRTVLDHLQTLFQFDVVEHDRTLVFAPRGPRSVVTIQEKDILPKQGSGGQRDLKITRIPDEQLPQQVNVLYFDKDSDHLPAVQSALYQVEDNSTSTTLQAVLSLSPDQAKERADVLLDTTWQERFRFVLTVLPRHQVIEPGDLVNLVLPDQRWLMRITRTFFQQGFVRLEGVSVDPETYQQSALGARWGKTQVPSPALASLLQVLDGPFDDGSGQTPLYFAALSRTGGDQGWKGAFLYESADNTGFAPVDQVTTSAYIGTVSVLPRADAPTAFWDDASVVTVTLNEGSLTSAPDADVLKGANACVMGEEILQFGVATLVGPLTYQLSHLLRGRRGTEKAMTTHTVGERFVLLDGAGARAQTLNGSAIGQPLWIKAVSANTAESKVTASAVTLQAKNLRPLSPVHLSSVRLATGDRVFSWIRRSRAFLPWQDGVDMPLSETGESYTLTLSKNGTLLRQQTVSSPSYTYTLPAQQADGVLPTDVLSVSVAQISERVGAGEAAVAVG
jgi:hypothetical protein